jgi:hypothetical protein
MTTCGSTSTRPGTLPDAASDDPKRHAAKLVRQLQAVGYRVTLEEVEAAEHSRHLHHSPGAVVR